MIETRQKLVNLMHSILDGIDDYFCKVDAQMNLIQFYFYEKYFIPRRPLIKENTFQVMVWTHRLGLQQLAPDPSFRRLCLSTGALGAIVNKFIFSHNEAVYQKNDHPRVLWYIPWGIITIRPEENEKNLARGRDEALLFCPDSSEISNEIDWFENEDAADSLGYQLLSITAYESEMNVIRKNLLKEPLSIYDQAIAEWRALPSEQSNPDRVHEVAADPQGLYEIDFAPKTGQSLAFAYEDVLKSIRGRQSRHRQTLRKIYKEHLEHEMFEGVPWTGKQQVGFLKEWESNLFGTERKHISKPGRWKQCEGIDRHLTAKFIRYFVFNFIKDPSDQKLGECACILWLFIWCAQECSFRLITIQDVLNISRGDMCANNCIMVKEHEVEVSSGLYQLLLCLSDENDKGERLFQHIDSKGKALERALQKASRELLGDDCIPVLPASFLIPPYNQPRARISPVQRQTMRNSRQIIPFRHTRKDVLSALKSKERSSNI